MSPVGNITPEEGLELYTDLGRIRAEHRIQGERLEAFKLLFGIHYMTDPQEPPPVVNPPMTPPSGGYGFDGDEKALIDWTFAAIDGAGRPDAVSPFVVGNAMEHFHFHPNRPGDSTDRGITSEDVVAVGPLTFQGVTIRGFLGNPSIEHGIYPGLEAGSQDLQPVVVRNAVIENFNKWGLRANRIGGLTLRDVLFVDIPGQALQQVQRDWHKGSQDSDDPATFDADMPDIVFEQVKAMNTGANSGNASFAFSLFAPEVSAMGRGMRRASQGVRARDLHVDNSMQSACKGGLFFEGKSFVDLEGGSAIFGGPTDRPLGLIQKNPGPVSMQDYTFNAEGGQDVFKVYLVPGHPFLWRGNRGDTRLIVNDVDQGKVSKDISW